MQVWKSLCLYYKHFFKEEKKRKHSSKQKIKSFLGFNFPCTLSDNSDKSQIKWEIQHSKRQIQKYTQAQKHRHTNRKHTHLDITNQQ